jgi:hypothetical protein
MHKKLIVDIWLETNGIQAVFNLIQQLKEHQKSKRLYYPKGADQKTIKKKKPFRLLAPPAEKGLQ